jgi:cytochrome c553
MFPTVKVACVLWACLATCMAGAAHAAAAAPNTLDTMAQRVVPCITCHGKDGRATSDGYFPRIAGKPAGYLYNQLLNFRDGRRNYPLMVYLVEHLSDDYLREMAQYFAALDLPYAPAARTNVAPAAASRGEALVRRGDPARNLPACAQCHGEKLTGVNPAIPGLLGLSRDYLYGQLGYWKTGERRAHAPDCMAKIASQLTADEIDAVSAWLSQLPVPADTKPAALQPGPLPVACGSVPKGIAAAKLP